ncbi:hypothetical protein HAX54_050461 [Datura stramonium]|uniref:RING-type domain-containing protein n=1 Tax=Datura stramonium TaxID=4076 RepID=A0ABS8SY53_DATST|nr:hypothetical protein [Datura stramonium]
MLLQRKTDVGQKQFDCARELLLITTATTVFIICGIKFRWFRPDNRLPPPFTVENDGEQSCCAVCLNDVVSGEDCRKLPKCGHVFHVECVDTWLECKWTCPICRRQVTDDLPKRQGESTILSYLTSRSEDFMLKIFSPFTEELMMVLIETIILPRR